MSFTPGGDQKAKIILCPKDIVCSCGHFKEPPREEMNCIKAKSVSLGDMLHSQTKRFGVPSVVWALSISGDGT